VNLGSFRILLPFFRTSWCVGILNWAIFNSFHSRVEFGMILEGLRNFFVGGCCLNTPNPPPPPRYATGWCISRCIVAPSPLWLQKHTDVFSHNCAFSSNLCHQPRLANLPAPEGGDFCGIANAITNSGLHHVKFL